jgi:hypothetical protein
MSEDATFDRSEVVTNWFGYWPSLHDAEVLSVDFHRDIEQSGPGLYLKVHAFEMTREVNEKGYFKCIKHCIIQFRFETVDDVSLRHFGHQNVIDGISLSFVPAIDGSRRIAVEVESLSEMELSLSCRRAVVADLTPGLPAEGVYTAS